MIYGFLMQPPRRKFISVSSTHSINTFIFLMVTCGFSFQLLSTHANVIFCAVDVVAFVYLCISHEKDRNEEEKCVSHIKIHKHTRADDYY
jgi:hypothetical protein